MSEPMIHNAGELEALAQRMGLLPFFACGIPGFSIEDFTPRQFWFVEGVDGPWEWRMDVAQRGVVAYGKLFHNKAGLVSREWYPDAGTATISTLATRMGWPAIKRSASWTCFFGTAPPCPKI